MTKQEKAEGEHMRKVYRLIRQLGMTSKYKGYYYVAEAVMMSMELQDYPIRSRGHLSISGKKIQINTS